MNIHTNMYKYVHIYNDKIGFYDINIYFEHKATKS